MFFLYFSKVLQCLQTRALFTVICFVIFLKTSSRLFNCIIFQLKASLFHMTQRKLNTSSTVIVYSLSWKKECHNFSLIWLNNNLYYLNISSKVGTSRDVIIPLSPSRWLKHSPSWPKLSQYKWPKFKQNLYNYIENDLHLYTWSHSL